RNRALVQGVGSGGSRMTPWVFLRRVLGVQRLVPVGSVGTSELERGGAVKDEGPRGLRLMKRLLSLLLVAVAVGAGVWGYLYAQGQGDAPTYRLEPAERGPLVAAVSSTGNLNAVTAVQVGTQVSGQVKELYADFNSIVHRGQVIARIDPATFEAKVTQA